MEELAVTASFFAGKRVLVTGHTGFKGSWLTFWLSQMGAEVAGIGLAPTGPPNLYGLLALDGCCRSTIRDINTPGALGETIDGFRPEIIFHMAAQSLVRPSYADPIGTFETNIMGTARLLEAVRHGDSVRSVIIVTSDKCYENRERAEGYREDEALGGHDPYSASKGAAEIVAKSMRQSYFQPFVADGHPARIATVRAGNVIGGGDWSQDRLIPDIVRGLLGAAGVAELRNPHSVRPWQHVLEPLAAYLMLAERLATTPEGMDEAWNIGPDQADMRAVADVASAMTRALGKGRIAHAPQAGTVHEAQLLTLDCTKARTKLGWKPRLTFDDSVHWTAEWYAAWAGGADMRQITQAQIARFEAMQEANHDIQG